MRNQTSLLELGCLFYFTLFFALQLLHSFSSDVAGNDPHYSPMVPLYPPAHVITRFPQSGVPVARTAI